MMTTHQLNDTPGLPHKHQPQTSGGPVLPTQMSEGRLQKLPYSYTTCSKMCRCVPTASCPPVTRTAACHHTHVMAQRRGRPDEVPPWFEPLLPAGFR